MGRRPRDSVSDLIRLPHASPTVRLETARPDSLSTTGSPRSAHERHHVQGAGSAWNACELASTVNASPSSSPGLSPWSRRQLSAGASRIECGAPSNGLTRTSGYARAASSSGCFASVIAAKTVSVLPVGQDACQLMTPVTRAPGAASSSSFKNASLSIRASSSAIRQIQFPKMPLKSRLPVPMREPPPVSMFPAARNPFRIDRSDARIHALT